MKKIFLSLVVIASFVACNKSGKTIDKLENDDQKASYAFGTSLGDQAQMLNSRLVESDSVNYAEVEKGIREYLNGGKERESFAIGQQIGQTIESVISAQGLEGKFDRDIVIQGFMDVVRKRKLLLTQESGNQFLMTYAEKHVKDLQKENNEKSNKLIEEKKKSSGAKTTASGLVYVVQKEGSGAKPTANSVVKVKYTGKILETGKVFDSTDKNGGEPVEFPLDAVIPGWKEGLQLMSPGAKYTFYIPAALAYGENGAPQGGIGPNQALEFEVELLSTKDASEESKEPAGGTHQLTPEQEAELKKMIEQQGK
ncbi:MULTISPECIES: FKBP-type peptidyl-prolyl cis-trans isomerase [Weeksella]|uniref:Peptidyl-prolyl cis-trans isomerase n=1 Tax=Weeksella virosa (strain ATCC 43766 / DSM 16922 / JCM 21250 / CCUG 30538 / CDC 9751 / IAM 14551 / NBRC 16016 / NCTC 11634 / CL345/78) TaxID=865938 RepID=F0P0I5_WEEVC|nr:MULTISPECIES: FKBP-type peptidyl-prolyl cis-trans isomerase [Weeksella]ADX67469.1 peptidylprolyl isomerase FKBP-type [Weeksella virosa DSM 16922]MDK7374304.1 FKBP-type peptidyl-prolyl cis-trans isomerase [Weeksella virosa]MDK7675751.1 FKBP-type peptidyl-prolyl cis-trans isomerase [Weeksella virosa]OFM82177.1 FKBP-type peptidylprolyl isomerase [Weeksella sp. HMSC059D05]SUP53763.1 Probable FKBP-type peptidyl-prolyl cis-trans isomerase fkpA precursor [Weeksella virosa]